MPQKRTSRVTTFLLGQVKPLFSILAWKCLPTIAWGKGALRRVDVDIPVSLIALVPEARVVGSLASTPEGFLSYLCEARLSETNDLQNEVISQQFPPFDPSTTSLSMYLPPLPESVHDGFNSDLVQWAQDGPTNFDHPMFPGPDSIMSIRDLGMYDPISSGPNLPMQIDPSVEGNTWHDAYASTELLSALIPSAPFPLIKTTLAMAGPPEHPKVEATSCSHVPREEEATCGGATPMFSSARSRLPLMSTVSAQDGLSGQKSPKVGCSASRPPGAASAGLHGPPAKGGLREDHDFRGSPTFSKFPAELEKVPIRKEQVTPDVHRVRARRTVGSKIAQGWMLRQPPARGGLRWPPWAARQGRPPPPRSSRAVDLVFLPSSGSFSSIFSFSSPVLCSSFYLVSGISFLSRQLPPLYPLLLLYVMVQRQIVTLLE
ncbi:hypothetical protein KSP39_PZI020324 [Platanthera zijinensis]|uniref:Uncharacterized protein n=1 Tax=Platanthera zijinensis TaxID=2320716 RepID=A0AAP0AZI7_9ASPA